MIAAGQRSTLDAVCFARIRMRGAGAEA